MTASAKLLFDSILLPDGWADEVVIEIDGFGQILFVGDDRNPDQPPQRINGCVIPGMPNCHSHAHQRAMSGIGEKAGLDSAGQQKTTDSFWTWRATMYHYLEKIQPEHLYAISQQLYLEMLKSGYTNVAEFQYIHHDLDGRRYQNPAEMTMQCMQAARDLGIGITALPVLYRYSGFGGLAALDEQKRFLNEAESFCEIVCELIGFIEQGAVKQCAVGIAPHSLRAISEPLLNEVIDALSEKSRTTIHIHIAEQTKEVDDCLAWSNQRPIEWLLNRFNIDQDWCAIHATHMTRDETVALAKSGAIVGLCPTTEANLGDGFFNLVDYVDNDGGWAIGSDSHISISPVEELRWLEYGQRLQHGGRNIMAKIDSLHTGRALLDAALAGGRTSSGRKIGAIQVGYQADFVVLDTAHARLYGRQGDQIIDSWLFSGNENLVQDVYVNGVKVIDSGHHPDEDKIGGKFKWAIDQLCDQ